MKNKNYRQKFNNKIKNFNKKCKLRKIKLKINKGNSMNISNKMNNKMRKFKPNNK